MIVSFLYAVILTTNPFLAPFRNADKIGLKNLIAISLKDYEKFVIYDQTHKVDSDDLYYFDYPVTFLALKKNETDIFQSVVFYIEADSAFEEKLKQKFGSANSTMTVGADIEDQAGHKKLHYETQAWRDSSFMMLVAPIEDLGSTVRFRVWIKQLI